MKYLMTHKATVVVGTVIWVFLVFIDENYFLTIVQNNCKTLYDFMTQYENNILVLHGMMVQ